MIHNKKQIGFWERIHTPMQKALKFGQGVVETGILAKGIYDVGSKIVTGARALAPAAAALL